MVNRKNTKISVTSVKTFVPFAVEKILIRYKNFILTF